MPKTKTSKKSEDEILKALLDLVRSEDTASKIADICSVSEIDEEEKVREIAYQTGRVLLGDLSPEELPKILTEKAKLSSFLAEKIARGINESIFNSVKESLATLYKEEIAPTAEPPAKRQTKTSLEEKPKTPEKTDAYRESVE